MNEVPVSFRLNGELVQVPAAPGERLLDTIRDRLHLTGTKEACGRGECGTCTVLEQGRPVMACLSLSHRARDVDTIEGLRDASSALRAAFADRGAFQCGFCTPGQIVRGVALLRDGLPHDDHSLRIALSGNLCRCTGYASIVAAFRDAEAVSTPGGGSA